MKVQSLIGVAALAVQLGVVVAAPADYNEYATQKDAVKRGLKIVTKTRTVTRTDDSAIVIVDKNGNVIRTQSRTPVTPVVNVAPVPPPTTTSQPTVRAPQTTTAPANNNNNASGSLKGFSVAYDPIGANGCRNFDTDFALLAKQGVGLIRVFDVGCNLGDVVTAAAKHNVKLMLGINDIAEGKLQKDLGKLVSDVNSASVKFGPVDTVYICNECVQRGASTALEVAGAVTSAKGTLQAAGFSGSVIAVDTFGKIKDDKTICSTSDYCGANIYAFFNADFTSGQAGKFVQDSLSDTKATNPGVRMVITETGWPHQGQANGLAVPSPQDQKTALGSIMSAFASSAADVFLFQPFDASYKQPGAFGVEPFFGILNQDTGALAF